MKKISAIGFKLFAAAFVGAVALLVTGCGMQTDMQIDESFSGERVIVCDELSDTSMLFTSYDVEDVTECLVENCPDEMEMSYEYTNDAKSKVVYTFTLKFTGLEDYISKVTALLGETPTVEFAYNDPSDQLFNSGFSLEESFTSADLLGWAKTAIKDELNLSLNVTSFTDDVTISMNDVEYDNESLLSSKISVNTIAAYTLDSLSMTVNRYGDDDYGCEVIFKIPESTVNKLTESAIESFFQSVTPEGGSGKWLSEESGLYRYQISIEGTAENLNALMEAVFGDSSSFSYQSGSERSTAFSDTGTLGNQLDLSKYPCSSDGSCDIDITYKNGDAAAFDSDDLPESAVLSEDGDEVSFSLYGVSGADITLYLSVVYSLSEVDVTTEITRTGKVIQTISLVYPVDSGQDGADFAAAYWQSIVSDSDISVSSEKFGDSNNQFAAVISTPADTPEDVSALLQQYFGEGNSISVNWSDGFELYKSASVFINVDVTSVLSGSNYDGEIMFALESSGKVSDAYWESADDGNDDILMGTSSSGGFEHPISSGSFTVACSVKRVNALFVILVSALALLIIGIIVMLIALIVIKFRKKYSAQKLAEIKNQAIIKMADGSEQLMEISPEAAANTVLITPNNSDGLDEDDDEPENVWLFCTALKMLSAIAAVLFFFSFFEISWTDILAKSESISGFDMTGDMSISDGTLSGSPAKFVLLAIPLVMLLILFLRAYLPKVVSNLICAGMSAFQLWYISGMKDNLEENLYALGATVDKSFSISTDWAYDYSLLVYALLLVGFIILLVVDSMLSMRHSITSQTISDELDSST